MKKITNPAYLNALKQCQLFANMDSRELAEAIEFLDGRVRKYDKEEAILLLGDALIKAGIVLEGTIESAFENENYDRISMRRFGSGYLFGEALVCNQISESPIQISAVNGATILFVDLKKIYTETEDSPVRIRLCENLIKSLSAKNLFLNQKVRILSQKSLREKIMLYLGILKKDSNGFITVPFNQTALAEHLGVNRSALSRELGRMQDKRILIIDGRKIKTNNKKANS